MITMELLGKIRRMHVREKLSERAIAKRTGLPCTNGSKPRTKFNRPNTQGAKVLASSKTLRPNWSRHSNPPWLKFESAGWLNIQSALTNRGRFSLEKSETPSVMAGISLLGYCQSKHERMLSRQTRGSPTVLERHYAE